MFLKTKEEIKQWLDKYKIENYIINDDLTVDVDGYVNLRYKNLTNIPIKFNVIMGYYSCAVNQLTNLQGAPKEIGGYFTCSYNQLTSLQFAPKNKLKQIIEDYPHLIHTLSTEELLEII
jgi:hypothetical protein